MKFRYILILSVVLAFGCSSDKKKSEQNEVSEIIHYNITIAADLSNRLNPKIYPKPISDTAIINLIIDNIYPKILRNERDMDQKDHFRFDFINKKQILDYNADAKYLDINFERFQDQSQRIDYLRKQFNKDTSLFKSQIKSVYKEAIQNPYGADIWTYFNEGINSINIDTTSRIESLGNYQFLNKKKNILILLTDGYLEAGNKNTGYRFGSDAVSNFRKSFKNSGETDISIYYEKHPEFALKAVKNPLLKDLHVLVLELYDRSETSQGASDQITDAAILKLIWSDWLLKSGVKEKQFKILTKFSSKAEAEKEIFDFIGV